MDRLTVMRSLVTVARVGRFNGAARSLGISGSLVSRQITGNTYLVLHKAALRGLGAALLPVRAIYDDVTTGRLRSASPTMGWGVHVPGQSGSGSKEQGLEGLRSYSPIKSVATQAIL